MDDAPEPQQTSGRHRFVILLVTAFALILCPLHCSGLMALAAGPFEGEPVGACHCCHPPVLLEHPAAGADEQHHPCDEGQRPCGDSGDCGNCLCAGAVLSNDLPEVVGYFDQLVLPNWEGPTVCCLCLPAVELVSWPDGPPLSWQPAGRTLRLALGSLLN